MKNLGRSLSLTILRPVQYLLDWTLFAAGVLLLVRFGLELSHSAAFNSLYWAALLRRTMDPALAAARAALSNVVPLTPGSARYLPLILSIAAWLVRSAALSSIRRLRLRIEEPRSKAQLSGKKPGGKELGGRKEDGRIDQTLVSVPEPAGAAPSASGVPPGTGSADQARSAPSPGEVVSGPRRFGRYEIVEEIGRGAMGAVYKATDPRIGRTVAIKIILTRDLPPDDLVVYKERFFREARAAGKMSHPGIITVHDIGEDLLGTPFLVMEYVEGRTLESLAGAAAERLELALCIGYAMQIAEALEYAHGHGVVHRDIKPANLLITSGGQVKIADFGVAKLVGTQYTQAGAVIGTPAFMAPEQLTGDAVDARSDLFSFGVVLYWMLTGEKPFAGDTITAVSYKVVHTAPLPARQLNPSLPRDLDAVLARCLHKNAAERYQSASDLIGDLQAVRSGRPLPSSPTAMP